MKEKAPSDLPDDPDALRDLVRTLWAERDAQESRLVSQTAKIAEHEEALRHRDEIIARLEMTLAKLQRWRFGRRSEQLTSPQRTLWEETLDTEIAVVESTLDAMTPGLQSGASESAAAAQPRRRHPGRTPLPETLPRIDVRIEPDRCTCAQCGEPLTPIGDEVTEKLDYIPGRFQVIRQIRPKLACRPCGTLESPALPASVIDKGRPTARLVAHVLTAKHCDHLPLYRQEQQYQRAGVALSRATLCSWLGQAEHWLSVLAGACQEVLLQGRVLHADETPLPVLNPGSGKTDRAYLWVYRSQADAMHPVVVFDYARNRKGEHCQRFLRDWRGILQTDDYAGYDVLYRTGRVIEAACWAHVRRHFYDVNEAAPSPVAQEALLRIAQLYAIEATIKDDPPERRRALRTERATPLLAAFRTWLQAVLPQVAAKSAIAKAIRYALKRWEALLRYCDEGALSIDNNPVYAASGIDRIMPTPGLCRVLGANKKISGESRFLVIELSALSKALEEGEQGVRGLISSGRKAARLGMRERAFLELHIGMQVDLGRLRRFVTEPKGDHAQIHSPPQQAHGRCVPQGVRRHGFFLDRGTGFARGSRMTRYEPLKGISAERSTPRTGEDGIARFTMLPRQPRLQNGDDIRS